MDEVHSSPVYSEISPLIGQRRMINFNDSIKLKSDLMARWIETEWMPRHPDADLVTLWASQAVLNDDVHARFDRALELPGGYHFVNVTALESDVATRLTWQNWKGKIVDRTGAFILNFAAPNGGPTLEVLVVGALYADSGCDFVTLASVPKVFLDGWAAFTTECAHLENALEPEQRVYVVGGRRDSFVPTVDWDDVILPAALKNDLLTDVRSFFTKGVEVYRRLNLKPFRKLLLAGVPGTGKTMICTALAKWALEQGYVVIYVSSARRSPGEPHGATFGKIDQALSIAANSQYPSLILLEELDAYLHREEKALVLNVLDGSESHINDLGTLLVATTNYPEAIDERVMKRPGRLDRIFIIPETRAQEDAEQMLRRYLGTVWQDDHRSLVPKLVGYPGAFIREVAVYALTQMVYDDMDSLPLDVLERSFKSLKDQIDARDNFLTRRAAVGFGGSSNGGRS